MGGGSNNAQKAAEDQQKQQQQQIAASQAAINALYNDPSRTKQYQQLGSDTTKYYTDEVNRQNAKAQRNLKFSLARGGLAGGSAQADEGQVLGQDYQKGLLQASQQGQQASNSLRQQDEQSRMNLLGLAQSGLDTTQASQQATRALQSNLLSSQGTANVNQLGDLFGNLGDYYNQSKQQAQQLAGLKYGYGSVYSPLFGPGAPGSNWPSNG